MNRLLVILLAFWWVVGSAVPGMSAGMVGQDVEYEVSGKTYQGFVSFHGGLDTPEGQDYSQVRAPILILHGSQDEVASMSDAVDLAAALDREGVDFSMDIYGAARHAFTVWGGDRYSRQADLNSWAGLKTFLDRQLR